MSRAKKKRKALNTMPGLRQGGKAGSEASASRGPGTAVVISLKKRKERMIMNRSRWNCPNTFQNIIRGRGKDEGEFKLSRPAEYGSIILEGLLNMHSDIRGSPKKD